MINVVVYQRGEGTYSGFEMSGHAGYADKGQDIVCAAVSVLVINTVNSIEQFTQDAFTCEEDPKRDKLSFHLKDMPAGASSELLLKSLVLGLSAIEEEYGKKHIKLTYQKDQEV